MEIPTALYDVLSDDGYVINLWPVNDPAGPVEFPYMGECGCRGWSIKIEDCREMCEQ
jgi:hypothetical protein